MHMIEPSVFFFRSIALCLTLFHILTYVLMLYSLRNKIHCKDLLRMMFAYKFMLLFLKDRYFAYRKFSEIFEWIQFSESKSIESRQHFDKYLFFSLSLSPAIAIKAGDAAVGVSANTNPVLQSFFCNMSRHIQWVSCADERLQNLYPGPCACAMGG